MREGASAFLIAIILFELYDFLLFKIACSVTKDPLDIRHDPVSYTHLTLPTIEP